MIHIVIPVHNGLDETVKCLNSLVTQEYRDFRVYVVDDGSTDGTAAFLRNAFPHVQLVSGDGDLWWTGAMRKGVEAVLAGSVGDNDFIMSLNNDVELTPDTLARLRDFASSKPESIVNAMSVDAKDRETVVTSGNQMLSWILNISVHPCHGRSYSGIKKSPISVDMLNGRSVLYPVAVFRSIGNFDDERFPHYAGDNEFTVRAKRQGWKLFILPTAVVFVNQRTTGLNPMNTNLSVRDMLRSLFTIKSSSNLMIRTRFAWRCCPWYALPTYVVIMYLKIFSQTILGNLLFRLKQRELFV